MEGDFFVVVVAEETTALGGRGVHSSTGAREIQAKKDPFHQHLGFPADWEKAWV